MPTGGMIDATPADMAERLFAHPEDATSLPTYNADMVAKELSLAQRPGSENHDTETEQWLIEIQCATLVAVASQDKLVLSEAASIYRAKISNCNVSIVYDAGHAILAERPEALISTVVDYVERRETFVVGNQSNVINP
jgi:pimeloyl-ACP methyl ester carboxylesterase